MLRFRTSGNVDIMVHAAKLVFINHLRTVASPSSCSANLRPPSTSTSTRSMNTSFDPQLHHLFQQKHSLRSKVRTSLKNMDPILKSQQDDAIQRVVLEAPWFKNSSNICAYISCDALREVDTSRIVSNILSNYKTEDQGHVQMKKRLYLPRVEDKNSNMKMLKVSSYDDLVLSSMNILEPTLVDSSGNPREDVMQATDPVDLFIVPGLAFDKFGGRLGRSGGMNSLGLCIFWISSIHNERPY
ncbi:5-formyltetrahydrofolate cyclo-ligase, mitochondrial isoform X3 [Arachis ipaensis]|uniref:5-formyltetrahydrofolate cyclo-ligase, mitochondrial isoform X3 n=1 Tax=Arachis ipaensis TaxID=130454 RepID=UPI000A2B9484|nr:5-formyltetrahydrofolate cyclo-ligase, mitochondrial isoform X3 [Arachis ipaensis]XP_029149143.1 5-formyltetrahydrofolate cyclo-ligase, mitochondrial isoform X2 [Arachis hypogaea]